MAAAHATISVFLVLVLCVIQTTHAATAQFVALAPPDGIVDATVNIVNPTTFQVKGMSYNGAAPGVYWWGAKVADRAVLMGNDEDIVNRAIARALNANGKRINPTQVTQPLSNADITVPVTVGTLADYDVVSFWCEDINADLGHFVVPAGITARKLLMAA